MANYEKMYALLCGAVDDVLDELNRVPSAVASAEKLQKALLDAEEMYVSGNDNIPPEGKTET